jgi:hypothetical protein
MIWNPDNPVILSKVFYIHANGQVLMQHDGDRDTGAKYFYLADRLGNTRLLIDDDGNLQRSYTYEPFGQTLQNVLSTFICVYTKRKRDIIKS